MKKSLIYIFIGIVLLVLFTLTVAKNAGAKFIIKKAAMQAAGLGLDIKSIDVGLLKSVIDIENLDVYNPAGFEDKLMADFPQIYIDYDLGAFFKKQVHLRALKINMREFTVIRNSQGRLNVNSIKGMSKEEKTKNTSTRQDNTQNTNINIDLLELKIGKVVYKDYTQWPSLVKEYPLNIDERYNNITDVNKLVQLIVARAILNTAISKLTDLNISNLEGDAFGIFNRGENILKKGPQNIEQAVQGITSSLGDIFK